MIRNRSFVLLLLAAVACDRTPRLASGADTGLALARSGRAKDSLIAVKDSLLGERQRQLSEQSQLIGDAATSARLVSEIGRDLANVKLDRAGSKAQPESAAPNTAEELATIQKKIKTVMARLNASQARVRKLREDSTTFTARDEAQVAQPASTSGRSPTCAPAWNSSASRSPYCRPVWTASPARTSSWPRATTPSRRGPMPCLRRTTRCSLQLVPSAS